MSCTPIYCACNSKDVTNPQVLRLRREAADVMANTSKAIQESRQVLDRVYGRRGKSTRSDPSVRC